MNADPIFRWIEESALSIWVRESPSLWAFPFILIVHAVGMGFLVGANMAIDLRVLGFPKQMPLAAMEKFLPLAWFGFWINAVSGILLLTAYPTKSLTNPLFYFKLLCIALGVVNTRLIARRVFPQSGAENFQPLAAKRMATASLFLWGAAIAAGRLLAYTYTRLNVTE